ncbi:MAG TPA: membrane dipeptidase [Thermomicrobiales bacterium]|nr:membrane dipeptidase [Thermomicrobiales bacterium]
MATQRAARLTPEEAVELHHQALVIDTQQPPITSGIVFTPGMRAALIEQAAQGRTRADAGPVLEAALVRDIQTSAEARDIYLDMWRRSGVTIACGTYAGPDRLATAFERSVRKIANAQAIIAALGDHMLLVRDAGDIERAHAESKHGIVIDFQNTLSIGDELDRLDLFHGLGLRMVQLTYNLQNLVGDGCTETFQGGLTCFGREVVRRLNELKILVDVSHCSEQVGWDAMEASSAPVIVSHSAAKGVAYHDRGKTDELARAIADQGGYFGVVVVPGFIRDRPGTTMDDVVRQIEHLVNVCGIDHVGIGTDKAGPGSGTNSLVEYPDTMPERLPGDFNWTGFRPEEHRLTEDYSIEGFASLADWPNITVALARAGFNEEELRKLLGLNYLRVFRDVAG